MRLIDVDELMKHRRKVVEYDEAGFSMDYLAVPIEEINNAPTVDAVPLVHGEWVDKGWDGDFSWRLDGRGNCWKIEECSICGYKLCGSAKTNFCPNCGAKMDGKKVHE